MFSIAKQTGIKSRKRDIYLCKDLLVVVFWAIIHHVLYMIDQNTSTIGIGEPFLVPSVVQ